MKKIPNTEKEKPSEIETNNISLPMKRKKGLNIRKTIDNLRKIEAAINKIQRVWRRSRELVYNKAIRN